MINWLQNKLYSSLKKKGLFIYCIFKNNYRSETGTIELYKGHIVKHYRPNLTKSS